MFVICIVFNKINQFSYFTDQKKVKQLRGKNEIAGILGVEPSKLDDLFVLYFADQGINTKLTTYQDPYPDGAVGVLRKGSWADLLILNGNAAEDLDVLGNTENILLVMKDGKIHKDTLAYA